MNCIQKEKLGREFLHCCIELIQRNIIFCLLLRFVRPESTKHIDLLSVNCICWMDLFMPLSYEAYFILLAWGSAKKLRFTTQLLPSNPFIHFEVDSYRTEEIIS